MTHLCLSCSSTIRPHDTHRTPCCSAPICVACIARNPRIVDWIPCLQCGDGVEAIKALPRRVREDERFVLGDDEEEEGPPGYDDVVGDESGTPSAGGSVGTPTTGGTEEPVGEPLKHRIQRGETVRSIATRYAMDPYTLIKLNDLPYTALTTHPTVIHARTWLTLAPSELRSGVQQPLETSEEGISRWRGVEDDQRIMERQAKRFQLLTKTPDPTIAKTYLALSSSEDPLFAYDDGAGEKEKPRRLGAEEAALARWFDDEEWEGAQVVGRAGAVVDGRKGKGKWVRRVPVGGGEGGKW